MEQIAEREYIENENQRLESLAQLIRNCGITVYELSKGTRIKYDTLMRALRKQTIRPENEARIRYYINKKQGKNGD